VYLDNKHPKIFQSVLGRSAVSALIRARIDNVALVWLSVRTVVISCLPGSLLLLSFCRGGPADDGIKVPFLYDIDVHNPVSAGLALDVARELVVHLRLRLLSCNLGA